jgi:two-component system LytT family response regulator
VEGIGVLIVDDEEPARQILGEMLGRVPGVRIVGQCANGLDAVRAAGELKPDCVFLDIQMPRLDGFEVMELLDPSTAVVFVTAYDSYAVKAFDVHAVDYVLKPFTEPRLAEALERARERLRTRSRPNAGAVAAAARPPGQFATRIVVRDGPHIRVIPVEKLDFAEAQDDFVALKTEGKKYLKSQTLAGLAASLDPSRQPRGPRAPPRDSRLPPRERDGVSASAPYRHLAGRPCSLSAKAAAFWRRRAWSSGTSIRAPERSSSRAGRPIGVASKRRA